MVERNLNYPVTIKFEISLDITTTQNVREYQQSSIN